MYTHFISCDWGTSSFRLRLVNTSTHSLLHEISSSQGIAATFGAYSQHLTGQIDSPKARLEFYLNYLSSQIQILVKDFSTELSETPVIVSGMASASIGMRELPYAKLPFPLTGAHAGTDWITLNNSSRGVLLISGLQSSKDVMRGEETQMIGLAAKLSLDEAICIFPGTHSKHIYCKNGQIVDFQTYMTGELFTAISTHTILQASLEKPAHSSPLDEEAFSLGVQASVDMENILHALFTVRTGELFKQRSKGQNYYYLSGLLIGKELQDLSQHPQASILLCSSSHLLSFYEKAIQCLGLYSRTTVVPAPLIDTIATYGQWQIFHQAINRQPG